MQVNPKDIKVVSEPWYRGSSLFGQALLFSIVLFLIDLIELDDIEWVRNCMPLVTVVLLLLVSQKRLIDKVQKR